MLAFVAAWQGRAPLVLVPTAYPQLRERDIQALGKVGLVIYGNHAIRAAWAPCATCSPASGATAAFTK